MVSASTIIILLGVAVFLIAGGGKLISPAITQAQKDIQDIRGGVSDQVQRIRSNLQKSREEQNVG